jgi:hypothetical protein
MKKLPVSRDGTALRASRRHRPRRLPKWLTSTTQLEAIARSRCLMVLSVLSGETPVTDAITQAKISRATYYHLETRALKAILAAMNPLAGKADDTAAADLSAASWRIAQLQMQVKRLEQDKRRAQRLLLMMRKSIRAPVTSGHRGRWPKGLRCGSSAPGASVSMTGSMKSSPSPTATPTPPGVRSP